MFYVQTGKIKLTVVSQQAKKPSLRFWKRGHFGESCLAGHTVRTATATTVEDCSLLRIDKDTMIHVLHEKSEFAQVFMSYLLAHTIRLEEDLADQEDLKLTYKPNGKPLSMREADSRLSQFKKCRIALVDLLQRDHELNSFERACMDNYLRLIEISCNFWKRRNNKREARKLRKRQGNVFSSREATC